MKTIVDLWNGNIAPCEHSGAHDAKANHLACQMERNREALSKELTDAQTEIFQKYVDCSEAYMFRLLELAYCDGFCTGGKLAMEMLL